MPSPAAAKRSEAYWRTKSSIRKRVAPALRSTANSDLSTRPWISSRIRSGTMAPPAHTAVAASRSKPPRNVKWRTARGQNRYGWTPAQQHLGHTSGRIQDMLATVQHQQGRCLAQVLHSRLQRRAAGSAANRFEHSAVDQAGVGQRSKLNQGDLRPTQVTGAEA